MARRSSARLRAKVSSTPQPQRVSQLDHDGAAHTPRTAPRLTSVAENDDMPGAFPQSASPVADDVENSFTTRLAAHVGQCVSRGGGGGGQTTPTKTTPIKPSVQEMHPQKYQMSTAKPLDEARWLGFSSMVPQTEPAKGSNKVAAAQGTPTRIQRTKAFFERPPGSDFTFSRPSLGLSPEARQLMAEKKEEAAKIRDQMVAIQESNPTAHDLLVRKMATPKSKVGRFSDVHMSAFKKMDSIADHPSAVRMADSKTPNKTATHAVSQVPRSLKRTQSKADLTQPPSALPRSTSKRDVNAAAAATSDAPSKRVKRAADDDTATGRPTSSGSDAPATPHKEFKPLRLHSANPHVYKQRLGTPTASSLARAASVKSAKRTGIPGLLRSPSKPAMNVASAQHQAPPTPLLARSPSKMTLPALPAESKQSEPESPLLSRSPVKHAVSGPRLPHETVETETNSKISYLARSPSKMTVAERVEGEPKPSKTPLLSRSPSKIAMPEHPSTHSMTPAKATGNLMARFNLLRAAPMKSILRTPQRLYSKDVHKLASGTHLATPEKEGSDDNRPVPVAPPMTAPVRKHVDFSASTKGFPARDDRPETPSKRITHTEEPATVPAQPSFLYPQLPLDTSSTNKKSHRRMTMALPSDFTFRVGGGITFAASPSRTDAAAHLKASIRHVSAEPEMVPTAGKKRKMSDLAVSSPAAPKQETSDKENDGEAEHEESSRPAKKSRLNAPESQRPQPSKSPAKKIPTLGVKPKSSQKAGDKRPGLLSQARLNLLATPKRRPAK